MPSIYPRINIIVQSNKQHHIDRFIKDFFATTSNFPELKLHVIHKFLNIPEHPQIISIPHESYRGKVANPIIIEMIRKPFDGIVGNVNADIWFSDGWLEDCLELLNEHAGVSPGYVETENEETFKKAVGSTRDATGHIPLAYGAFYLVHEEVFNRIGYIDDNDVDCEDLDLMWRLKINGLSSVTSKKITIAHMVGASKGGKDKDVRARYARIERNLNYFYKKHGYVSYRDIRRIYKNEHRYFKQFR